MRVIILSITKFWQVVDAGISIYDDDDLGKRGRDEKKERRERGRDGERRRDDREGGRREERRGRLDFPPSKVAPHFYFSGMREMISTLETDTGTGMKGRTDTGRTDMQERTEAEMRNRWELFEGELLLEGINSFRTGWQQQEAGLLL